MIDNVVGFRVMEVIGGRGLKVLVMVSNKVVGEWVVVVI